ncbi:oxidoreductase Fe-S subunit [Citrobacter koseri]|nr:oxidoreductase Fe-S subunit [Citrobacter koseri]
MSFTRRKFVLGMGTVIFFSGPGQNLLANTKNSKAVRYAMIHDESRCNGCNLCARRVARPTMFRLRAIVYPSRIFLFRIMKTKPFITISASPASTVKMRPVLMFARLVPPGVMSAVLCG